MWRCPPFEMWRDYLGLAAAVAALSRRGEGGDSPVSGGSPSPSPPEPLAGPGGVCAFCRHNGEAAAVWRGHRLRDAGGRVLCPVLRGYVCPQCGATRGAAHTRRFCPLTPRGYVSVYARGAPPAPKLNPDPRPPPRN